MDGAGDCVPLAWAAAPRRGRVARRRRRRRPCLPRRSPSTARRSEKLREFCDTDARVLVFAGDGVAVSLGLPKKPAPKGARVLAFIKLRAAKLAEHRPGDGVLLTELGAEPLETLERLLADVYLPLLSNPANTEGWSDVVSHDVVDTLHAFLARVSIANGAARGETCLPLPPLDAATAARLTTKDRVHLLEGAVATWSAQIKVSTWRARVTGLAVGARAGAGTIGGTRVG